MNNEKEIIELEMFYNGKPFGFSISIEKSDSYLINYFRTRFKQEFHDLVDRLNTVEANELILNLPPR